MSNELDLGDRGPFLNMAGFFEGGLALAALVIGWLVGIDPLEHLELTWTGLIGGLIGALPLLGLFAITFRFAFGPFRRIRDFLVFSLGPSLVRCYWYDLILLAVMAGVCEEILFRGLLQPWCGLVGSNVIFGLAHFITPMYALLAGVLGLYLGFLYEGTREQNLLIPIVTHAFYDYVAFLVVAHAYRTSTTDETVGADGHA